MRLWKAIYSQQITVLLLAWLCSALAWALVIAPRHAPDEQAHFDYVRSLVLNRELPVYGETGFTINPRALNPEAFQQPLYYVLAAPLLAPLVNESEAVQYSAVRLLSLLCGLASMLLIFQLGRELVPMQPGFALACAAVLGFLPGMLFQSATITNDALLTPITSALLLLAWRATGQPRLGWHFLVGVGVLLGLALLVKMTALVLVVCVGIALLAHTARQPRSAWPPNLLRSVLLVGLPILVLSGWSLLHNWQVYGDPTTFNVFERFPTLYHAVPYREHGSLWEMLLVRKPTVLFFWDGVLHGLWGAFDSGTLWRPIALYLVFDLLLVLVLVGAVVWMLRSWRSGRTEQRRRVAFAMLCVGVLVALLASVIGRGYQIDYQAQSRYLLPAAVPLVLAVCTGARELGRWLHRERFALPVLLALVVCLNVSALCGTLIPVNAALVQHAQAYETLKPLSGIATQQALLPAEAISAGAASIWLNLQHRIDGPLVVRVTEPGKLGELASAAVFGIPSGQSQLRVPLDGLGLVPDRPYILSLQAPQNTHAERLLASVPLPMPDTMQATFRFQVAHLAQGAPFSVGVLVLAPLALALAGLFLVRYWRMAGLPVRVGLAVGMVVFGVGALPPQQVPRDARLPVLEARLQPGTLARLPGQDMSVVADLALLSGSETTSITPPPDAQGVSQIQLSTLEIDGASLPIIAMQPPSTVTYTLSLSEQTHFHTALALNPAVWTPDHGDGVEFVVQVLAGDRTSDLFRQYVDPKQRAEDRRWIPIDIDLSEYAGQHVELVLATNAGPRGDPTYDWAAWGQPQIVR